MKNNLTKLMTFLVLVISVACSKVELGGGGGNYGDLAIFWGEEAYTVEAGQSVPMAFTIIGTEGVAVKVTPSVNDSEYQVRLKLNPDYTGVVTLVAPDIVLKKKNLMVTLLVTDKHGREASMDVPVVSNKSEALAVEFAAEIFSVATQPGKSFDLPFVYKGLASAEIVSKSVTLSNGWQATTTWPTEDKPTGIIRVTAPSVLTETLTVKIAIKDDYDRQAELDQTLNVVEIATTAGAANSYIVKPGGNITIKGVKGNSTEALDFDNAGLVWQDNNGMVKSVAGNGAEGVVVVSLNSGKSGNALVCARKGATIVWSWHLWVTDYDPAEDPFVYTSSATSTTYTFMDRDLGAMSNKKDDYKSFGLFYQWGRKDPFIGSTGALDSVVPTKIYDINGNEVEIRLENRPKTEGTNTNLELSIANPDLFLYMSTAGSTLPADWLTSRAATQNNDLWGGVSGVKTIYDPCPEGWEIPASGDPWRFRFQYKKQGNLNDSLPYDESYPWYIDYEGSWGFRYKTTEGKEYWFPFAGKRDAKTGEISGTGGGAQYHTRNTAQTFSVTESFAWGNPSTEFELNRPYGSSVRCIKEN
ncbi:MAG: hypothetical protein II364_02595 [Bacteroidales bacterium]|nr:hypothetical protein [Bacteroidales bacterium]MBQ1937835.1 hypothetical protein [Bacteroidales bacterium]